MIAACGRIPRALVLNEALPPIAQCKQHCKFRITIVIEPLGSGHANGAVRN
jgi:hypothetical protein